MVFKKGNSNHLGYKHSEETKKKISEIHRGKKVSEETKKKISNANKGHKVSEEVRKKISESHKGILHSDKTKKLLSDINRGKKGYKHSEETKKKISNANKGNKYGIGNKSKFGKKNSEKTRKKISEANKGKHKGKECHFWKGGISKLTPTIRASFQYRQWRSDVFTNDDYACRICGRKGGQLEAHHIKEFHITIEENNIKTIDEAIACSELWDLNNGMTLCKECHKKIHSGGKFNVKKY
jgi:5-methylcytosine-specific restriction endonuclease McrA